MSTARPVVTLLLAALMTACVTPIELSRDFVSLAGHESASDFRAVTADDARVWVRRFDDANEADLEFWAQVLEHDFVQQRGYDLVGQGDVENADHERGRWFECVTNVRGERVGYLIAVWANGSDVLVVEFAARGEIYGNRVECVRVALWTVRR